MARAAQPMRRRDTASWLLGCSVVGLIAACLLTLWATISIVTYNVDASLLAHFTISALGVLAVVAAALAVRQAFNSPAQGSPQLRRGWQLLAASVGLVVVGLIWLNLLPPPLT